MKTYKRFSDSLIAPLNQTELNDPYKSDACGAGRTMDRSKKDYVSTSLTFRLSTYFHFIQSATQMTCSLPHMFSMQWSGNTGRLGSMN